MLIAIFATILAIPLFASNSSEAYELLFHPSFDIHDSENVILESLPDSIPSDSLNKRIEKVEKKESSFRSKVKYHADDSIMIDNKENKAILWGNAWVEYEDINLKADYLEIDFAKNEVLALGLPDSNGKMTDTPIFTEKGKEYKSGEMLYNFHTKKGLIKKITTQEASGYIHGETIKMASQDVFYIKNGKYTTCNLDHPHYHIQAKKLKIINDDKIVTGPAFLVIEDVPTFLAVPFGFFPNQDERTSGILPPAIGSSATKGFNLTNGGYYFGVSDMFDLKLLGDVYTNGSWSGRAVGQYNTRYKRNGSFSLNYTSNNDGERDTPEFIQNKSMFINWSHSQAPKAKPNSDFRAQVSVGSSDYFQNDLNTSTSNYIRNEFSSNITYTQKFGRSPFSASLNASHNQNSKDSIISFTLPEASLNMARIYPFKRKVKIGKDRWYEKVGINYTGNFKNRMKTKTNQIFNTNPIDPEDIDSNTTVPAYFDPQYNFGAKHAFNLNTNLKLGNFTVAPGVRYDETWYTRKVTQTWDPTAINDKDELGDIVRDSTEGMYRYGTANINASINTKMYGIYAFRGERLKAIRHTMTPSISVSYIPDLSVHHPDYFGTVQTDTLGNIKEYHVFEGESSALGYGSPSGREQGVIGMGLQNIIEMKRKKRNDTTDTYTNVNIIDRWNFATNYDMLADSFNWKPMTMSVNGSVGRFVLLNLNTTSDFYGIKEDSETGKAYRSKQFNYNLTKSPLRLTRLSTSVGLNFSGNSNGSEKEKAEINKVNDVQDPNSIYQEEQFVDFNIPWNMKVNYIFTYSKPLDEEKIVNSLSFSGSVNLTPGWKVRMSSSFDFDQQKLGFTTIDVYRDLHCWQIDLNVTPFGDRKSFRINLKVKQGFLQDLKLSKNSRWFDG